MKYILFLFVGVAAILFAHYEKRGKREHREDSYYIQYKKDTSMDWLFK